MAVARRYGIWVVLLLIGVNPAEEAPVLQALVRPSSDNSTRFTPLRREATRMISAEPSRDITREERRDRYRDLARSVIELGWRDARANSCATETERVEAREFLFSEAAELWADMAQFDLRRLRLLLEQQTPPTTEAEPSVASPDTSSDSHADTSIAQ